MEQDSRRSDFSAAGDIVKEVIGRIVCDASEQPSGFDLTHSAEGAPVIVDPEIADQLRINREQGGPIVAMLKERFRVRQGKSS